jgi:hypothetical protein
LVHPSGHCDQQKPERVESSRYLEPALSEASQSLPVFGRYEVAHPGKYQQLKNHRNQANLAIRHGQPP